LAVGGDQVEGGPFRDHPPVVAGEAAAHPTVARINGIPGQRVAVQRVPSGSIPRKADRLKYRLSSPAPTQLRLAVPSGWSPTQTFDESSPSVRFLPRCRYLPASITPETTVSAGITTGINTMSCPSAKTSLALSVSRSWCMNCLPVPSTRRNIALEANQVVETPKRAALAGCVFQVNGNKRSQHAR
jgi:hypothetical protein